MDEGDLIVKGLETEPVKNLLGPVTKELGLIGDDLASIVRFYINLNLQKVFKLWAKSRKNKPLPSDTDFGNLLPLIQLASLQSDEELQARWAALLENAVVSDNGVLPSFGQTLSQLTAQEARYIDRLYAHVRKKMLRSGGSVEMRNIDIGRERELHGVYDERLSVMSWAEALTLKRKIDEAHLAADDLLRLGIIARRHEVARMHISERDLRSLSSLSTKIQDTELELIYSFTEYGLNFVRAVSPSLDVEAEAE
jgi:hypothetical protein